MMIKKKKVAAALAAVSLYLQQEAAVAEEQECTSGLARAACSPWGQSARQEMMAMRRLLQLRTFARL